MNRITQETILAMELNRSHIGKLVQLITDSWSMTGTLSRVDQHDNREWSIDYANYGRLVPSGGEILAELWIGPWRGEVIGNQPVTVETVAGTLEAPERKRINPGKYAVQLPSSAPTPEEMAEAREIVQGSVVDANGDPEFPVHHLADSREASVCGLSVVRPRGLALTQTWEQVTCRECLAFKDHDDLPPEPPADWSRR